MQNLRSPRRTIMASLAATLISGSVLPAYSQPTTHLYMERIESRYEAKTLPAFEITPGLESQDEARLYLLKTLSVVSGNKASGITELTQDDQLPPQGSGKQKKIMYGTLNDDPEIGYRFHPRTRRLDVINNRVRNMPREATEPASLSETKAVEIVMDMVDALHQEGIVDKEEFDLADLQIATHVVGHGRMDEPLDRSREQIVDYRITIKRQLNGVPVVGSFLRVVVHHTGAISELNIAYRPVKSTGRGRERTPVGRGASVPIDRTPAQAQQAFERGLQGSPDDRLDVERWGLAYLDTGSGTQRFYQPAYVFLVSPLTETPEGSLAARKFVRAVPASARVLEELPFDPLRSPSKTPVGDVRPLTK